MPRKIFPFAIKIFTGAILFGLMLDLILDFGEATSQILRAIMFSFIGVAYIVGGIAWDKKWVKLVLIACGLYLIAMNFIPKSTILTIIGIICILAPMLIIRFLPEENHFENKHA